MSTASSCNNKGKGKFVSGPTQEFITIYILAHGTTIPDQKTPSWLKNKVYKLSLGGVNGNLSFDSRLLHTLIFNSARRLSSNRVKQPVEKLYDVREEVFRYTDIKDEIRAQHEGQQMFVMREKSYQKCASVDCWLPNPFAVVHNHMYTFAANPWARPTDAPAANGKLVPTHSTHTEVIERQKFGVWVVDASMRIAKKIGLLPGIQPNVVSLMQLLGILPTTTRSPHDTDNATTTTLFHIVDTLHRIFGHNVSVCVIDNSCRYTNWDQLRASQFKHGFGRSLSRVSQFMRPYVPTSLHQTMRRTSLSLLDSRPPRPANPMAVQVSDLIVWNEFKLNGMGEPEQKRNRITFWKRDGKIQCGDEHDPTVAVGPGPYGPDGRPGNPISYRIGDKITLPNGRTFTIFYIMPGSPTWFFTHADPEVLENTGMVVEDDEDDEYEDIDEDETKTLYFAVIGEDWHITSRPVAPTSTYDLGYDPDAPPAPLLPPHEYPVFMVPPMRGAQGGGTRRKQNRHNRLTTMKKRAH